MTHSTRRGAAVGTDKAKQGIGKVNGQAVVADVLATHNDTKVVWYALGTLRNLVVNGKR